ncbi:MAG: hypothetical protein ABSC20_07415 [Candidatus Bathyarchaeia archaeon]
MASDATKFNQIWALFSFRKSLSRQIPVGLFLIDFLVKVAGKSNIIYLASVLGIIAIASGLLYLAFGLRCSCSIQN